MSKTTAFPPERIEKAARIYHSHRGRCGEPSGSPRPVLAGCAGATASPPPASGAKLARRLAARRAATGNRGELGGSGTPPGSRQSTEEDKPALT